MGGRSREIRPEFSPHAGLIHRMPVMLPGSIHLTNRGVVDVALKGISDFYRLRMQWDKDGGISEQHWPPRWRMNLASYVGALPRGNLDRFGGVFASIPPGELLPIPPEVGDVCCRT